MLATQPTHNDYRAARERLKAIEFGTAADDDFKIKAYTKSELAEMYGVHVNTLSKWIDRHLEKFEAIGYSKRLKMLDPCMVRLFVEVFSVP